ncbi:hypothetical protein BLA24_26485 [Streptomyces cinnamoneus]|uniref:DUF1330 domain-containing protein n=1 Tax=Streptomyces cinnamoneus TaxID=53446 RepID=A0A2G1XEE4_STRCJ|nr:DUF1330 domain-containing protein [Streptomyces cinnamoneus]PHQ49575.1 hypothetical protein BLA24_26485 [Streptomyces cinnamoneus]PPT14706.1 DUF1330 domain-containing protein [Streptomyces cinnamoneus]
MTAYALAHLAQGAPNADVLEYMERIQTTLDPFGGRFLVHGATVEVREGTWPGALVVIGFPGIAEARAWYDSPAYQDILPLRTRHLAGDLLLVDGVAPGYDPKSLADKLRPQIAA